MKNLFYDFFSLIYPNICMACNQNLQKSEKGICTFCRHKLPVTNYHLEHENPLMKYFWGRINIHAIASMYFFNKGSKVQRLLHRLKYEGRKEIGILLGEIYGFQLKESNSFSAINAIIPVPLHAVKKNQRGFNQSEVFAEGLSKSMEISFNTDCLFRITATQTQTKKSRIKRWENVEEKFKMIDNAALHNKHILLVDDVITTGATLEACAQKLLLMPGVKISIATIACA